MFTDWVHVADFFGRNWEYRALRMSGQKYRIFLIYLDDANLALDLKLDIRVIR
jgi:hypothetical protein